MQYTLRNIPSNVDRVLRLRARQRGLSLNEVALEALARGVGVSDEAIRHRNLRDLAGTWVEDRKFDAAILEQDIVDDELWG